MQNNYFTYYLILLFTTILVNSNIIAQCTGDSTPPNVVCVSNASFTLDNNGLAIVSPTSIDNGSTDNCGIAQLLINGQPSDTFDCDDIGPNTVTLTAIDSAGNSADCTTTINLTDAINPTLNCPTIYYNLYTDNNGLAIVNPGLMNIPYTDNCNIVTWKINGQALDTFDCSNVNNFYNPQITVIDNAGNTATCNIVVQVLDSLSPIAVCANTGTVQLDAGGQAAFPVASVSLGSSDNCSINNITINGQPNITLTCADIGMYPYTLTMTDGSGNIDSCQSQLEVKWSAACGFLAQVDSTAPSRCDTSLCSGYASVFANGGTLPYTYLWADGNTNDTRNNLCPGTHKVTISDAAGITDSIDVLIVFEGGCVWPGDTDDDALANNFDLLPIALAYGDTGISRQNASLTWEGQDCQDWNTNNPVSSLPNYKHIDADGNGIIDSFDVRGIVQNYGEDYQRYHTSLTSSTAPPIFIDCDTAREGDYICMNIHLGNVVTPAVDVYAIAFTINYDPSVVQAGTANIGYTGSWFGAPHEVITIQKDFPTQGKIETAIGRIDHNPVTGFGKIGTFCIGIRDDILRVATPTPDTTRTYFDITNIRLIDHRNTPKAVSPFQGCLVIVETIDAVNVLEEKEAAVAVYPNPSDGNIHITSEFAEMQKIEIRTIAGQLLIAEPAAATNKHRLDLKELPEAMYIMTITTKKGLINKRIIIRH